MPGRSNTYATAGSPEGYAEGARRGRLTEEAPAPLRKEPNTPTGRSAVTPAASLLGLAIAQATGAARAREHLSNPDRRQCPVEGGGAGASHGHQHSHAHCEHVILIAFTLLGSEPVHEETELIMNHRDRHKHV